MVNCPLSIQFRLEEYLHIEHLRSLLNYVLDPHTLQQFLLQQLRSVAALLGIALPCLYLSLLVLSGCV